jgi:hypothetical protein
MKLCLRLFCLLFVWGFGLSPICSQKLLLYKPLNQAHIASDSLEFSWKSGLGPYILEIGIDSLFSQSTVFNFQSSRSTIVLDTSQSGFFWRVIGGIDTSLTFSFQRLDNLLQNRANFWFEASPASIELSSSVVSKWRSKNDTNFEASQSQAFNRPSFVENALGGHGSVKFGKAGALGQQTFLSFPQQLVPYNNHHLFLVGQSNFSSSLSVQYFLSGGSNGLHLSGNGIGNLFLGAFDGSGYYYSTLPSPYRVSLFEFKGNSAFYNSNPTNFIGPGLSNNFNVNTIGARLPNNNLFFYGLMSEILFFDTTLSSAQANSVNNYLKSKYARVAELPYDTQACAPSIILSLPYSAEFSNILWSTGATTASITLSQPGTYWVRGTSVFGVTSSDTVRVSGVFPAPIVSSSGIQPLCLGDTLTQVYVNPDPVQPWQWNTGTSSDTLRITQPGQYWLLQTDSSGCVLSSDTLEVINRVDGEIALSVLGCTGDTTIFQAQVGDLLGSPIVYYDWDFGPFGSPDTLHQASASTVFSQPGPQTARLIAYNSLGCPDTVALTIQVPGSPTAQFSQPHACAGTPMPLSNQSVIPPGTNVSSYRWEYWNGQSSNLVGPLLHFSDTGMYPMALKVFLANGCSDSIQSNIHVFRQVTANFVLPFDSLCQFAPLPLSDASTYLNSSPGQAVWRLGGAQADTGFALQLNPGESGLLPLRLSVKSAEGCVDSLQKQVWVNATPQADIGLSQQLGFPPLAISVWDASDKSYPARNFGLNGQQFWSDSLLSLNLTDTGLYRFSLLVTDNLGCRDSSTKNLRLIRPELSTEIKNLRCEKKGSLYAPDFELQNSSVLLPIQKESFDFWVENSATMRWEDSVLVPPGLTIGFQSKGSLNAPKSPRFCCVKPVSLISEYAPGLFLNVSGETTCAALVDPFFLADVQPNPSRGEVLVRFHLSAPGKVSWRVIGGDGKSSLVGEGDYAAGMQQFSIPAKTLAQGSYSLVMTQGDNAGVSKFIVLE